jgi:hypothetical protein
MLKLFVTVSLNPLQQGSKSHLLFTAELGLLLFDELISEVFIMIISLRLFFDVTLNIELLSFFVSLGMHELLYLLSHFHELFRESDFH